MTSEKESPGLGIVMQASNPSTQEAKAAEIQVQGQPGLHIETMSQKKKKKRETRIFHFLILIARPSRSGGHCVY
jgi:hypothetical protein